MVLHNDKWKKKASKKYYNKHGTALTIDLKKPSCTGKTNISSEADHHESLELPSNAWKYEETIISDEDIWVDYTKVIAKEFTLPEPDIITYEDELPKDRFRRGKLVYEEPENAYHLRRQVENEASLKEIKKKYNSRVKVRTVKGLCLDMEKSESDIEDIDELLKKTELMEKQASDNTFQQKPIQMDTTIKDKQELEDFLDKLLD